MENGANVDIRADIPLLEEVIYLDAASTTLPLSQLLKQCAIISTTTILTLVGEHIGWQLNQPRT